ncbi:MAG: RNB domain-containing ribonuclease [Spirochaetaceae bacterium]|jgi:exoribonuclease-2|nr:RNB domain-containing ribonuclease [Spirochaetaceae bacterium]
MIGKNALALYKNEPAVVSEAGEKITIVCASGESKRVREKDVVLLHPGPLESLKAALGAAERFNRDDGEKRLAEAHELLLEDQGAGGAVPFRAIAELAFGSCAPADAWAQYRAVRESPLFQEATPGPGGVSFALRTPEEAEKLRARAQKSEDDERGRQEFIARLRAKNLDLPGDLRAMQEVEAFALGQSPKCRVLQDAGFPLTPEKAHGVLLETGVWTTRKNPHPARRGLSMRSSQEPLGAPPEEERFEPGHTAFAIDSPWCDDPDDAVFFDGQHLWVHVADPASIVKPDTRADLAARNRGATLYLPEGAARMLCEGSLADYALGLSEVSRALSFKIGFDEGGNVASCEVLKTRLRVKRYTYDEADRLRDSPELSPLFELARRNQARREKQGALTIDMPEVHIQVRDNAVSIEPVAHPESAGVVREMMLLAGEAAARFAFRHGIAFPYACQPKPVFPEVIPEGMAGNYARIRSMHSRVMSASPSSHAGLGLAMYSQVTSPLRRYGDLVAHQQLRAFIDGERPLDKDAVLERIAAGDAASVAVSKAERESNLHWTLVYLMEHPEWQGDAVVVDPRGYQAAVIIPSIAKQETITTARKAAYNDVIPVRAGKISLCDLSVRFIEAG